MKTINVAMLSLLAVALLSVASCTKTNEAVEADFLTLQSSSNAMVKEFPNAKLRRITHDFPNSETVRVSGVFTYNKNGDPISLLYNNNGTGNPNHYFFYDNQSRLTEWRQTYQNGSVVIESHKYVYDNAGIAIRDTARFIEGDTVINVYTFTYDHMGRIVKENIKNIKNAGAPLAPQRNPTYTYDARGNLAVAGWRSSSYDNMNNPLRLHPVFQFIHKNWSRNNCASQPKYDAMGFPQHWQHGNDRVFNKSADSFFNWNFYFYIEYK